MKNNKNVWYAPLLAQFQAIEDAMPLSRFAAIEAVLHLLTLTAPDVDPTKAYLLFTQYQLIGAKECTAMEHTLQQARNMLGYYRSQKYWQDDLRDYRAPRYNAVRAFSFQEIDGTVSFSKTEGTYPYPYAERQKEWGRFWPECFEDSRALSYAEAETYRYVYPNLENGEVETIQVKFDNNYVPSVQPTTPEKGYRPPIVISSDELLNAAKEMEIGRAHV